ncbi:MucR family transcriptional regulator [Methylobacterium platani]|uniref:MucR family transcriptional regulator n=2 Tax=Methylobacterium platani TaxID=427683 RepID=A0A179SHM1_9HYPH|nr:MucR family transcriptional regulator [Methylobacterium platani]KMO11902.1 MucR family transcriptional regulator [Methylobacterium platani JCM 14648]OAS26008.1 MucR family transcriptional regulator [Methylobacterium platani]
MDDVAQHDADFIGLAASIVGAYVTRNNVPTSELPGLITSVHASLSSLGQPAAAPEEDHKVTAAQIRKSVTPDAITSFLDGKPYKSLKRHLNSQGYTPDEYRQKFGLPRDYPMVAATYAAQRSELAKSLGLGQIRRDRATARKAEAEAGEPAAPARRGRPKKVETASAE